MNHDVAFTGAGNQLYYHLVDKPILEWLSSLWMKSSSFNGERFDLVDNNRILRKNNVLLSDWNQLFAKFNLLFPSSSKTLEEQELILNTISNCFLIPKESGTSSGPIGRSGLKQDFKVREIVPLHLNLLFNPLMAMKIDDQMCLHDFRANFSYPEIRQYNMPKPLTSFSMLQSDSLLNLFTTQQLIPKCIESILNTWNEQQEITKKAYSAYSWPPLERKVNILMNSGDEPTISIPEPPLHAHNSSDSLRDKIWRICKLANGDIDCVLSSNESLIQVEYFCEMLAKYIPNLDSATFQHALLVECDYRNSLHERWVSHINNSIPYNIDESDWYSLMTCIVSYCFGECNGLFKDLLKQLDYYRSKIFKSNESEISIFEITTELFDSFFSLEEQEHLELLLVKLNDLLKSNTIGECPINLSNWLTISLLYDLHRNESAIFLRNSSSSAVWDSLQSRIPTLTTRKVPFTYSPTFILLYLATSSYSKSNLTLVSSLEEITIFNPFTPSLPLSNIELDGLLKECKHSFGDPLTKGAKLDFLISHIVGGKSDHELEPNRNNIHSTLQRLDNKSIEQILQQNLKRDQDFTFLCSLSILIVKERFHMRNIVSIPKFSLHLPFMYSFIMKKPFQTTLAHPILLNRNAINLSHRWYPLLINSKTNTQLLATLNEQLEMRKSEQCYFGNPLSLYYERLTSIRVTIHEKIYLLTFILKQISKDAESKEDIVQRLIVEIQRLGVVTVK